ncbi:hypothetical protein HPB47_012403 [Ixodes persulcatus]|uniref:Uncharacterized protein n=1 Tax=Ixodes persulcatus TaxID=34615 RepID=A0AC60NTR6_IXOPE|nr:hypothetical protein HPB47_012403 [Ixodes persulcatus]
MNGESSSAPVRGGLRAATGLETSRTPVVNKRIGFQFGVPEHPCLGQRLGAADKRTELTTRRTSRRQHPFLTRLPNEKDPVCWREPTGTSARSRLRGSQRSPPLAVPDASHPTTSPREKGPSCDTGPPLNYRDSSRYRTMT